MLLCFRVVFRVFIFSRGSASSSQKLSSRGPMSANCYIVLVAMSTEFILENSASLGAAHELKWIPVP